MKVCPKCGAENANSAVFCENCQEYIEGEKQIQTDLANVIFEREERKAKHRRVFDVVLGIAYIALYIALYIRAAVLGNVSGFVPLLPILLAGFYYIWIFKADALFFLENMLKIDNIEDVKISDWYYISNRIAAYVCLCVGIAFIFSQAIAPKNESGIAVEAGYAASGYTFESEPPSEEQLSKCGAISIENTAEAKEKLEQFYLRYSVGVPNKIILTADNKIFELVFEGGETFCCFVDENNQGERTIVYNYNCRMENKDKEYIISDKISGFSYVFAF